MAFSQFQTKRSSLLHYNVTVYNINIFKMQIVEHLKDFKSLLCEFCIINLLTRQSGHSKNCPSISIHLYSSIKNGDKILNIYWNHTAFLFLRFKSLGFELHISSDQSKHYRGRGSGRGNMKGSFKSVLFPPQWPRPLNMQRFCTNLCSF